QSRSPGQSLPRLPAFQLPRLSRISRPDPFVGSTLECATLGTPENNVFYLAGQLEVLVADTAGCVILELHGDPAPSDREVGMMVGRLRQEAHRIDQHQRSRPSIGLVNPPDPAILVVPAGQLLQ